MTRTIRIKSHDRKELSTLVTDASTKQALIDAIIASKLNLPVENVDFVNFSDNVTYKLPNSIIPLVDCILLIVPTKTNQGMDVKSVDDLEEMGYNELRTYGSMLNKEFSANISLHDKRQDILERITDWTYGYLDKLEITDEFIEYVDAAIVKTADGNYTISILIDKEVFNNKDVRNSEIILTVADVNQKYKAVLDDLKVTDGSYFAGK